MKVARKGKAKARVRKKPQVTQHERTEAARAKIMEAAFRCIGTGGYSQATLNDIAALAGCSRELPRYHFGSKENLLKVALEDTYGQWIGQLQSLIDAGVHGMRAVTLITDGFVAAYREDSAETRGRLALTIGAAEPGNPELREGVKAMQEKVVELFRRLIVGGPDFRSHHDAEAMSSILYSTLRGIAYQWMTEPGSIDVPRSVEEFKRLLRSAFGPADDP